MRSLDVVWVEKDQRAEWIKQIERYEKGKECHVPVTSRRCQRVLVRSIDGPVHIDGKTFLKMETPMSIRLQPGALNLLEFTS
jgi:hypothetical protein